MKVKVLFVCMGNICRSPTAEGVFAHLAEKRGFAEHIHIDSAGTTAYHAGEPPDPRAQQEAERRGIPLANQRSRGLEPSDFQEFDYIIAMDHMNMAYMRRGCPKDLYHKLHMCMQFAPHLGINEVPDPYYGGKDGFAKVFDMVEAAAEGLLERIRREHLNDGA